MLLCLYLSLPFIKELGIAWNGHGLELCSATALECVLCGVVRLGRTALGIASRYMPAMLSADLHRGWALHVLGERCSICCWQVAFPLSGVGVV